MKNPTAKVATAKAAAALGVVKVEGASDVQLVEGAAEEDKGEDPVSATDRAAAGHYAGKFTAMRHMQGDRDYAEGDARDGTVQEFAHLLRLGVIAPADAETAEAVALFTGLKIEPVAPTVEADAATAAEDDAA